MKNKKDMEVVYLNVDDLIPAEYNPRKISPKQKKELMESIEKYGILEPLVINQRKGRENVIIGGHQRQ